MPPLAANPNWDGSPVTLGQYGSVQMPQTPDGSMILAYRNTSAMNSLGKLAISSGGTTVNADAPALQLAPMLYVKNWQANNLKITNLSLNSSTTISVEAYGPGMPGQTTGTLNEGTPPTPLAAGQSVMATSSPNQMQLIFRYDTSSLAVFAIVGGPATDGNNAYVIAVNYNGPANPPGYFAAVSENTYTFPFNWGSSFVYIAYFGAATILTPQKLMRGVRDTPPQPTVLLLSL